MSLSEVVVDIVVPEQEARFRALMQAHHYLGALPKIGETLWYVAHLNGTWLTGTYPRAQDLLEAAAVGQREKAILARLWISEGIPFAFRGCPGLYEEVRELLAKRLELDAKQISVAGSGRLGYSLAPTKWGEPYGEVLSDLDLFAVSEGLFERLRQDFERWRDDYGRREAPSSYGERERLLERESGRDAKTHSKGVHRFDTRTELATLRSVLGNERLPRKSLGEAAEGR